MLRPESLPEKLEDVSRDMAELVGLLKSRRARRILQGALKRGQGPMLSLSAAVSASLVSAAAHETELDPLAGLIAVDELSALGDICLPSEAYAENGSHDHQLGEQIGAHAGRHGGAFYLADPFASPFANVYSSGHTEHQHAVHEGYGARAQTEGHAQHGAAATGAPANSHAGHEQHQDLAATNTGAHVHDAAAALAPGAHSEHQQNTGPEHGVAHSALTSGHSDHHAAAVSSNNHAQHGAALVSDHSAHAPDEQETDDLSELINALAGKQSSGIETPAVPSVVEAASSEPAEPAEPHSHHASLADMNLPPVDDLAAAPSPAMI